MCYGRYINFLGCDHFRIEQQTCHVAIDMYAADIFCPDYNFERVTIYDACLDQECRENRQRVVLEMTLEAHKSIQSVADQVTREREARGEPDPIQETAARLDAWVFANLEAAVQQEMQQEQRPRPKVSNRTRHHSDHSNRHDHPTSLNMREEDLNDAEEAYMAPLELSNGSAMASEHNPKQTAVRWGKRGGIISDQTAQHSPHPQNAQSYYQQAFDYHQETGPMLPREDFTRH